VAAVIAYVQCLAVLFILIWHCQFSVLLSVSTLNEINGDGGDGAISSVWEFPIGLSLNEAYVRV